MTTVYLTPGAELDAARLCERAADDLTAHLPAIAVLADSVGEGWLGSCEEGRGWARLLREKACGSNSLCWLVDQHVAILAGLAAQLRGTAGRYRTADSGERQWPSG